eukprot:g22710.t1
MSLWFRCQGKLLPGHKSRFGCRRRLASADILESAAAVPNHWRSFAAAATDPEHQEHNFAAAITGPKCPEDSLTTAVGSEYLENALAAAVSDRLENILSVVSATLALLSKDL